MINHISDLVHDMPQLVVQKFDDFASKILPPTLTLANLILARQPLEPFSQPKKLKKRLLYRQRFCLPKSKRLNA